MPASETWTTEVCKILIEELGIVKAIRLVERIKSVKKANASVRQTLSDLAFKLMRKDPSLKGDDHVAPADPHGV